MNQIYMDHAATTPVRPEVLEAMLPFFGSEYGNPSSVYGWGRRARQALDQARDKVSEILGAEASEIIFTSGGSEGANLAIKGAAWAYQKKGRHIVTSAVEHHAVLDSVLWLKKQGFEVTIVPVDEEGMVSPAEVEKALRPDTTLVTIMHANNEVGTIQPIREISEIVRNHGALFHTDAVQTAGVLDIDVKELGVDMLSLSAHKLYGPKGVGALYVRKGVRLDPLIHGGAQEKRRRAGTENTAGIVGLAKALELAHVDREEENARLIRLRDRLLEGLQKIPHTKVNGSLVQRLPNNVNVCFQYIEGESMLLNLDLRGIAASSGSACTSGSLDPSHVLLAMGLSHEIAHGSLRLTLGRDNTESDIDFVLQEIPVIVERLRAMSPLYQR
ncbi:MAG: cysteine desulfurase NifS [Bacillota bacterium]|jgi:cysteine desulfurase|nr:cysteine desulfurase NifS [Bacillota bacterium]NLJ02726.1 cysteine desulfurase NifS [Bacillota bacterium]